MSALTHRIRATADLRDIPTNVTWNADHDSLVIRLSNSKMEMVLDLGPEVAQQLRQALSWAPTVQPDAPRKATTRLALCA